MSFFEYCQIIGIRLEADWYLLNLYEFSFVYWDPSLRWYYWLNTSYDSKNCYWDNDWAWYWDVYYKTSSDRRSCFKKFDIHGDNMYIGIALIKWNKMVLL